MSDLFEWHPIKAEHNHHKHDVTFEEAQTVFDDPLATLFPDDDHSDDESREIIIRSFRQTTSVSGEFHPTR